VQRQRPCAIKEQDISLLEIVEIARFNLSEQPIEGAALFARQQHFLIERSLQFGNCAL
jgi:hypothetical protein